jgi:hypothetical protein
VSGLADSLHARSPRPELAEELMLFGRFVGSWRAEWTGVGVEGKPAVGVVGEVHFGWALGGRAVQDTWIVPGPEAWSVGDQSPGFYGTTIRFYDPALGAWRSTWIDPPNGVVRRFIGRPDGDGIVLLSDEEPPHLRWRFSEIEERSARWSAEIRADASADWRAHQAILLTRTG